MGACVDRISVPSAISRPSDFVDLRPTFPSGFSDTIHQSRPPSPPPPRQIRSNSQHVSLDESISRPTTPSPSIAFPPPTNPIFPRDMPHFLYFSGLGIRDMETAQRLIHAFHHKFPVNAAGTVPISAFLQRLLLEADQEEEDNKGEEEESTTLSEVMYARYVKRWLMETGKKTAEDEEEMLNDRDWLKLLVLAKWSDAELELFAFRALDSDENGEIDKHDLHTFAKPHPHPHPYPNSSFALPGTPESLSSSSLSSDAALSSPSTDSSSSLLSSPIPRPRRHASLWKPATAMLLLSAQLLATEDTVITLDQWPALIRSHYHLIWHPLLQLQRRVQNTSLSADIWKLLRSTCASSCPASVSGLL